MLQQIDFLLFNCYLIFCSDGMWMNINILPMCNWYIHAFWIYIKNNFVRLGYRLTNWLHGKRNWKWLQRIISNHTKYYYIDVFEEGKNERANRKTEISSHSDMIEFVFHSFRHSVVQANGMMNETLYVCVWVSEQNSAECVWANKGNIDTYKRA